MTSIVSLQRIEAGECRGIGRACRCGPWRCAAAAWDRNAGIEQRLAANRKRRMRRVRDPCRQSGARCVAREMWAINSPAFSA